MGIFLWVLTTFKQIFSLIGHLVEGQGHLEARPLLFQVPLHQVQCDEHGDPKTFLVVRGRYRATKSVGFLLPKAFFLSRRL